MVLVLVAAPVCVTGAGALLACLGVVTTQLSTRLSRRCAPNPGGRVLRSGESLVLRYGGSPVLRSGGVLFCALGGVLFTRGETLLSGCGVHRRESAWVAKRLVTWLVEGCGV